MAINVKALDDFKRSEWGGLAQKPAMILTYIALENHRGSSPEKERVLNLFYPDKDNKSSKDGLKTSLSNIRSIVGERVFPARKESLKLNVGSLHSRL